MLCRIKREIMCRIICGVIREIICGVCRIICGVISEIICGVCRIICGVILLKRWHVPKLMCRAYPISCTPIVLMGYTYFTSHIILSAELIFRISDLSLEFPRVHYYQRISSTIELISQYSFELSTLIGA